MNTTVFALFKKELGAQLRGFKGPSSEGGLGNMGSSVA